MPYAGPPVTGHYLSLLRSIHAHSRPRTYLEIGMRTGESLALAEPETSIIGIDPCPTVKNRINADAKLFFETSDEFFADHDVRQIFGGSPIDLSFIDGMHLFEYALRDFRNVEENSAPESVILVHDCLPREAPMATRERATAMWTGDTWKLVCCLKAFRPDLEVSTIAVKNTGLAIIRNLDPSNRVLFDRYDEALAQFLPLEFDYIDGRQEEALGMIPVDLPAISGMIPQFPARPGRVAQRQRYPRSLPIMRYRGRVLARVSARRVQRAGQALISRPRSGSTVTGREDADHAR